ncbi:MAG: tetratricopeptide repeat protein [Candidatus Methylumidiphilus sp.]
MTRRKIPKPAKPAARIVPEITAPPSGKDKRNRVLLLSIVMLAGLVIGGVHFTRMPTPVAVISPAPLEGKPEPAMPVVTKDFVGAATCKQCHQAEFKAWQGSDHDLAMQEANEQTVLGDFNNAKFKHADVESTFFKRDGKFMVRTDGPDGKLTDYPITYAFGVKPLQQYLIAFPGGRYQALSIAWDSRPKAEGGQRWFHLYPKDKMDHTDQLHWTKRYQNWNMECAECHSTNLKKGYDAVTDSYKTTFNEINVACETCHDPHSLKLRAEGNALCTRCHNAAKFDTGQHHFHKPDSKGAQCMDCHAPEQNYMVNDGRHDHSFRLPRPDLSLSLGSPNACTQCHEKQKPEWATSVLDKWHGKSWRDRPHYGTVLQAGATHGLKALPKLLELAQDSASPAIVRATALTLVAPLMGPELLAMARQQLKDTDPSVRIAALGLIESVDTVNRVLAATPLLTDPVRGVRIEAARILADVPDSQISSGRLDARKSAMTEYLDYLKLNADWPAENVNLGNLYLRQHNLDAAITAYQRAIALDPRFVGAYVNLADAYRQQGRDGEGEKQLRQGLSLSPDAADLHHALGLLLVRKTDKTAALQELAVAAKLMPDNARYAYVYAIGLNSAGKQREALAVLKAANVRQPYNLDILSALISMQRE